MTSDGHEHHWNDLPISDYFLPTYNISTSNWPLECACGGQPPCCTKQCNQVDVEQVDAIYIDVETEEGFEVNEDRPGPLGAAGLENL